MRALAPNMHDCFYLLHYLYLKNNYKKRHGEDLQLYYSSITSDDSSLHIEGNKAATTYRPYSPVQVHMTVLHTKQSLHGPRCPGFHTGFLLEEIFLWQWCICTQCTPIINSTCINEKYGENPRASTSMEPWCSFLAQSKLRLPVWATVKNICVHFVMSLQLPGWKSDLNCFECSEGTNVEASNYIWMNILDPFLHFHLYDVC